MPSKTDGRIPSVPYTVFASSRSASRSGLPHRVTADRHWMEEKDEDHGTRCARPWAKPCISSCAIFQAATSPGSSEH